MIKQSWKDSRNLFDGSALYGKNFEKYKILSQNSPTILKVTIKIRIF